MAKHRKRAGLTQGDMACLIGASPRSYVSYESGQVNAPIDQLIRIAHACDLTLSQFFAPLDGLDVPLREVRAYRRGSDEEDVARQAQPGTGAAEGAAAGPAA